MIDEIIQVFKDLSIKGEIVDEIVGPAVTRYHIKIPSGSTLKSYVSKATDLALYLGAKSVTITPVVGTPLLLAMDVPNAEQETVPLPAILTSPIAKEASKTAFGLGKNMYGKIIMADIVKMPHLLIAGTTGSGKSVCLNSIIFTLLIRNTPEELQFVMIDPKMVELSGYNGIPHLIMPVVTDVRLAGAALEAVVDIMEDRYSKLMQTEARNIESYNNLNNVVKMSRLVVIVDEMADLMMTSGKDVENYIIRIAQKARACGIHLIVATQRPERAVITGLIKANIPSRIAFMVRAKADSRIILDEEGAENLLGKGDMLYYPVGQQAPERIQGCWIDDGSITSLIERLRIPDEKHQQKKSVVEPTSVAKTPPDATSEANDELEREVDKFVDKVYDLIDKGKFNQIEKLIKRTDKRVKYADAALEALEHADLMREIDELGKDVDEFGKKVDKASEEIDDIFEKVEKYNATNQKHLKRRQNAQETAGDDEEQMLQNGGRGVALLLGLVAIISLSILIVRYDFYESDIVFYVGMLIVLPTLFFFRVFLSRESKYRVIKYMANAIYFAICAFYVVMIWVNFSENHVVLVTIFAIASCLSVILSLKYRKKKV
ncbi:MAG: FtsK/SpoIIIE domain-containing protein [Oscillospiraceae bacterium]|nr:FtsK/SpoIIIE domain-containing protein [Oscillospiraceae bacterium]